MTTNSTDQAGCAGTRYVRSAAEGMLASLEHYGYTNPAAGDGRVSTPAWYANRLAKVLNARGDALPGSGFDWWGGRYGAYAKQLLAELDAGEAPAEPGLLAMIAFPAAAPRPLLEVLQEHVDQVRAARAIAASSCSTVSTDGGIVRPTRHQRTRGLA